MYLLNFESFMSLDTSKFPLIFFTQFNWQFCNLYLQLKILRISIWTLKMKSGWANPFWLVIEQNPLHLSSIYSHIYPPFTSTHHYCFTAFTHWGVSKTLPEPTQPIGADVTVPTLPPTEWAEAGVRRAKPVPIKSYFIYTQLINKHGKKLHIRTSMSVTWI